MELRISRGAAERGRPLAFRAGSNGSRIANSAPVRSLSYCLLFIQHIFTGPILRQALIPAVGSLDRWLGRPSSSRGSSEPGAWAMVAVPITTGWTPAELRALALGERDGRVSARLRALANALDGMSRDQAARAAGMDRQTLRDWVHRYN